MKSFPSPIPPNGWPGQSPVVQREERELTLQDALKNVEVWDDYELMKGKYPSSQHEAEQ